MKVKFISLASGSSGNCYYLGMRELAISHFGRNVDLPFVPDTHLLHCDNPALYQFVQTERYWCSATTAVELLSVYCPPRVVCDNLFCRGVGVL